MSVSVLVIAAHPDDEVLGCGGAILHHTRLGHRVTTLFLADGVGSRDQSTAQALDRRRAAARKAAETLGSEAPRFLDFPDNRLDTVPLLDVVKAVETVVADVSPSLVYTHHAGDLNIDHRICHQAALTACRPMPGCEVSTICTFEVPSSTEWAFPSAGPGFQPNRYIDISGTLAAKLEALESYGEELRPFPHPRSPENVAALAKSRGAAVGVAAAEAFVIVRDVIRS